MHNHLQTQNEYITEVLILQPNTIFSNKGSLILPVFKHVESVNNVSVEVIITQQLLLCVTVLTNRDSNKQAHTYGSFQFLSTKFSQKTFWLALGFE